MATEMDGLPEDTRSLKEQLAHCNGQDCSCAAFSSSECACDADWTPGEVYRLRAELTTLRTKLAELHESALTGYEDGWHALRNERDALKAELAQSRETVKRLNRRVQVAEAGVAEKVKESSGRNLGRALANAAAEMYRHERDEARAKLAELKRKIAEAPVFSCEADIISGRDYDYISAVLRHADPTYQYPDLDGQRITVLTLGHGDRQ
jgi:hypothetical protein